MEENEKQRLNDALKDINALMKVLNAEDDRGVVMSLAAFFEEALGGLLVAFFRDNKSSKDLIEGFNAPLGTFSARAKAAHALGLISNEEFQDCERLRKIRNKFAHSWTGVTLQQDDIKDQILNLSDRLGVGGSKDNLSYYFRNALTGTLVSIVMLGANVIKVKLQPPAVNPHAKDPPLTN